MRKNKFIIITLCFIVLYVFFQSGVDVEPAEKIDIPSGAGIDLVKSGNGEIYYKIPQCVYIFVGGGTPSFMIHTGVGKTIGETRENRQVETNKKFLIGLEKVILFGEEVAGYGLETPMGTLFANPTINDTAMIAICKGQTEDILALKINNYPTSSDYMEGMLKNLKQFNFFSDNYKLIDVFVRLGTEGRNVVLPYIEKRGKELRVTGLAIFKKDKMIRKLDLNEAKTANLLRENKVKGVLTIQKNTREYIDFYGESSRRIKCDRLDDEYKFIIDLDIKGDIISNSLYKDLEKDPKVIEKFEKDMAQKVEKMCYEFLDIMKNEYKVDCLELGWAATGKFGHGTGADWNEIVCRSDIEVNVQITVDRQGRGSF